MRICLNQRATAKKSAECFRKLLGGLVISLKIKLSIRKTRRNGSGATLYYFWFSAWQIVEVIRGYNNVARVDTSEFVLDIETCLIG